MEVNGYYREWRKADGGNTMVICNSPHGTASMHESRDLRLTRLESWLNGLPATLALRLDTLQPASSDASFRRYFRLQTHSGNSLIVMDAPPEREDSHPFVHVAGLLQEAGVTVPEILVQDLAQGFLLLSDLGSTTYYAAVQQGLEDGALQVLYRDALAALVRLQGSTTAGLPVYDEARLLDEMSLFPEWYVERHHGSTLTEREQTDLETVFQLLARSAASQPCVLVHRDFHSPNLMVTYPAAGQGDPARNPGILDFQDALLGPITYDIASLVTDARTTWDEAQQLDWAIRYWEIGRAAGLPLPAEFSVFHQEYEWMSLQRNLRIMGVFCRLNYRDGKPWYLDHLPRVTQYVRQVAQRYQPLRPLLKLLDRLENIRTYNGIAF